jgi:hypothetical protein
VSHAPCPTHGAPLTHCVPSLPPYPRCHRLAGAAPAAGREDLLRFALDPGLLLRFNPLLSDASQERLAAACLLWGKVGALRKRHAQRGCVISSNTPAMLQRFHM